MNNVENDSVTCHTQQTVMVQMWLLWLIDF